MRTLRVGIVGAGWMGHEHARAWLNNAPRGKVVAVADISPERARHLSASLGEEVPIFSDLAGMVAEGDVDAVDVCLPHHLHAEAILASARAGKAILCEKPLCTTLADAAAIRAALQASGATFMAAHNQLFQPSLIEARRLLALGALGRPYVIRSIEVFQNRGIDTGRAPIEIGGGESPWMWRTDPRQMGGGEVLDTGWHATYRLLALANDRPVEVTAMMDNFASSRLPAEDTGVVTVRFASGAIGQILTSWALTLPGNWHFEVAAEHGSLAGNRTRLVHQLHGWPEAAELSNEPVHTFTKEVAALSSTSCNGTRSRWRRSSTPPASSSSRWEPTKRRRSIASCRCRRIRRRLGQHGRQGEGKATMYTALDPNAIGIRGLSLNEAIELARASGFEGLVVDVRAVADEVAARGADAVRDDFARAGVRPALWNLPTAWRDDERWQAELRDLPRLAAAARAIGAERAATHLLSGSDTRPYEENFAWHVARLRPIAEALRAEGCRFGLEFVGTKTFREHFRYPFLYTLDGLMGLIAAIGVDSVGLLLDSWHLFASGGSLADLDRLGNDDIVVVHVNDAPAGIPWDDQIDTVRTLPMETGVIDLVGFMGTLQQIGCDGPVMPEPFSQRVNDLAATDRLAAARETAAAMSALWQAAGLA